MTHEGLEKLRNVLGQLQRSGMTKRDLTNLLQTLRYSPPVKPDEPERTVREAEVSPTITGLHRPNRRQEHRMSGDTSGQGLPFGSWTMGDGAGGR